MSAGSPWPSARARPSGGWFQAGRVLSGSAYFALTTPILVPPRNIKFQRLVAGRPASLKLFAGELLEGVEQRVAFLHVGRKRRQ